MAKNHSSLNTKALYQRIRSSISEADRICGDWDYINASPTDEDKEQIEANLPTRGRGLKRYALDRLGVAPDAGAWIEARRQRFESIQNEK